MDDFVRIISTAGVAGVLGVCLWFVWAKLQETQAAKDEQAAEHMKFLKGLLDDKG